MAFWGRIPTSKEIGDAMSQGLDKAAEKSLKEAKSDEQKKLLTRLKELLKSNLNEPELDFGFAIQRAAAADPGAPRFVMLSGMKVRNGRELERLARDAATQIKPGDEEAKLSFDVARAADGTAIHQMTGPVDQKNPEMAKHFGKASLFFAFRDDAVLATFGESGLASLQRAIEEFSKAPASGSDGPVAATVRVAVLGEFAEKDQEALRRASTEAFKGQAQPRDRVSLGLKGEGDEIRLRLAIDLPAIQFLSKLGIQMNR
jgi:DnaJ-domain-containing protein 1